ncbi:MAG: disA [Planctomycetaceae bacterium]|nr:disA [Planctomycetaceae bacterium]
MKSVELTTQVVTLLAAARRIALENDARAVVILADVAYEFHSVQRHLERMKIVVASSDEEVQKAAKSSGLHVVALQPEVETRQMQLSQTLLEAIADDLLQTGDRVIALYASFERDTIDTLSIVDLGDHLEKLTARDLQRLETQVPLPTLRSVVDLAVEIGREGREGKAVGTLFVVGDNRKTIKLSHEGVHDPFRGYPQRERELRDPRVRESIKELAQLDGAFIISSDGVAISAGRILDAPAQGLTLSKGLGSRHWAAAAISKVTRAVAITVSESTGTVRIFVGGKVVLRIEPLDRAMKWHDVDTEPPPVGE